MDAELDNAKARLKYNNKNPQSISKPSEKVKMSEEDFDDMDDITEDIEIADW